MIGEEFRHFKANITLSHHRRVSLLHKEDIEEEEEEEVVRWPNHFSGTIRRCRVRRPFDVDDGYEERATRVRLKSRTAASYR